MITAGATVLLLTAALAVWHTPAAAQVAGSASRRVSTAAPLRLLVYPRVSRAPAIVRIQARVEPAEGNRALEIIIDSDDYYRSSTIELEGAEAPRVHSVEFRHVPVGVHEIRLVLTGATGAVRATVHDRVLILE
jgi:hypothetical protein